MNRQMLPNRMRRKVMRHVGRLISRLVDNQVLKGVLADFTEHEIIDMCLLLPEVLAAEPPLLELYTDTSSIMIVGDIYTQYGHLVRLFNCYGHPPQQRYLFLGNFTNQGNRAIETVALLFAYKFRYPKSIYLLRGKHECTRLAKFYGFYDECMKRFSRRIWNAITQVFSYLPVAATIDEKIFCVHSGLSPMFRQFDVRGLDNLKAFVRKAITLPAEVGSNRLLTHFVWSEPDESIEHWDQNPAGQGYLYGTKVVQDFCERFNLVQIIRSSEMVKSGYEFFRCSKLLTIFSAPDFMEYYANNGVLVHLSRNQKESELRAMFKVIEPIIRLRCKPTLRMNIILSEVGIELGVGLEQ